MKIVINGCFGGFSLSMAAIKRLAELNGKKAYFFEHTRKDKGNGEGYHPVESDKEAFCLFAFDVPNPNDFDEKELLEKHELPTRPDNRADPLLVQVVEELGKKADGFCASLEIVEIPDGVDYEIQEYDGSEHIAEKHRTWW